MNLKRALLASVLLAVLAFLVHPPVVTAAETVLASITVGTHPSSVKVLGTKVYVYNNGGDTISIIDTANGNSVTTVSMGSNPTDIVPSSSMATLGNKVYMIGYDEEKLYIIDGTTDAITSISVPGEHYEITATSSKIFIANYDSNSISVVDTLNSNSVSTITTTGNVYTIYAYKGKVYAGSDINNKVFVIDPATDTVVDTVSLPGGAAGLTGLGNKIYVGGGNAVSTNDVVYEIDTANGNSLNTIIVEPGGGGQCLACYGSSQIAAAGNNVFVGTYGTSYVYVIDTANGNSVSGFSSYGMYQFATIGSYGYFPQSGTTEVYRIEPDGTSSHYFDVASDPYGIAASGTRLYITSYASNKLSIVETDETAPSVSLTSPSNGATVSGSVSLAATASDNGTIAGVQFKIDGANQGAEDTSSSYGVSWDSTLLTDGPYTIDAVARDAAGNYATSTITVTVDNTTPPAPSGGGGSNFNKQRTFQPVTTYGPTTSVITVAATPTITTLTTIAPAQVTITPPVIQESKVTFTKDLSFGMADPDIRKLQIFLNTHGFKLANYGAGSPGSETTRFGAATRYQLSRFQKANGISPAAGYFGPKTRNLANRIK